MSQQNTFNFMAQCNSVEQLLNACVAALPLIGDQEQGKALVAALRKFEDFGCPALWSAGDVSDEAELSEDEKRLAICRFIEDYSAKDADWAAIDKAASDIASERVEAAAQELAQTN